MEIFAIFFHLSLFALFLDYASCGIDGSCEPLPFTSLPNGDISRNSEGVFSFRCHQRYFLAGPSQVRCFQGEWTSKQIPVCMKSEGQCNDPVKLEDGEIFGDDRKKGSAIQYMCHPGFVLIGDGRRTCLDNGVWSGRTPSCLDQSESLPSVAKRLEQKFVTEIGSHSSDSIVQGRLLDKSSTLKGLELVILLDRSSSIDPGDFKMSLQFIKFLFDQFGVRNGDPTETGTRVAVIVFGTEVNVVFNVDDATITSPEAAGKALDELKAAGGGTALQPALAKVFTDVHFRLRKDAKKALFLITDGEPNVGSADVTSEEMARMLKEDADFEIFAVGIGRDWNRKLLTKIASEPFLSHVFFLNKYSDLSDMISIIKDSPPEVPPVRPEKCGYIDPNKIVLHDTKTWPWMAAVYVSVPRIIEEEFPVNATVQEVTVEPEPSDDDENIEMDPANVNESRDIPKANVDEQDTRNEDFEDEVVEDDSDERFDSVPKVDTKRSLNERKPKMDYMVNSAFESAEGHDFDFKGKAKEELNESFPFRKRSTSSGEKVFAKSGSSKDGEMHLRLCGGVLICSEWVLTAASCLFHIRQRNVHISTREVFVVLQESALTEVDETQMNFYAVDVNIHPDFDPFDNMLHNLALVKLNKPAPVNVYRPVCLPPTDKAVPLHMDLSTNTSVAGWGLPPSENDYKGFTVTNTRLHLATKMEALAEERECNRAIRKRSQGKNIFCAGLGSTSSSNCVGSVGSPIIAKDPDSNLHHVLGILNHRSECMLGYSQYTELRKYIRWISDSTDKCYLNHWN